MITARQLDTLNNNKHTTNACSKQPSALKLLTKQCNITFTYITFINIINYELSTSLKPGGNFFLSQCVSSCVNSKRQEIFKLPLATFPGCVFPTKLSNFYSLSCDVR